MSEEQADSQVEIDGLARECIYRFLSTLVAGPDAGDWLKVSEPENQEVAIEAWRWLQPGGDHAALSDLIRELQAPPQALRSHFDQVFGLLVPRECPPYETEYYPGQEPFGRSQLMADVAGFYRAFGIEPASAFPARPDHLALELEFMAFLLMKRRMAAPQSDAQADEQKSVCERALREFCRDHLAWWVPAFAQALRKKSVTGYLCALGDVLSAWIPAECRRLKIDGLHMPVFPAPLDAVEGESACAGCALNT
jgi:TorA maturation chaperone TorD